MNPNSLKVHPLGAIKVDSREELKESEYNNLQRQRTKFLQTNYCITLKRAPWAGEPLLAYLATRKQQHQFMSALKNYSSI